MCILGVDGGIASVGWAVVDIEPEQRSGRIVATGTWMFDSPEEATQTGPRLKNADRRMYRGQRRVVRRRAQRMRQIRRLFVSYGMIENADRDALRGDGLDPWSLRAEGLDRRLSPREWAVALGHIAIHRGFRSIRKGERGNAPGTEKEKKGFFSGLEANHIRLEKSHSEDRQYRTIGEMFARDPLYVQQRRNRAGSFTYSIYRRDQEDEVRTLFVAQRRYENPATDVEFRDAFILQAFSQRPLKSSEELVGPCPFEPGERRAARFAPGFERFRLYSRLTALRLQVGRAPEQPLAPEQIADFPKDYGSTAKLSFTALRKHLALDNNTRFAGVSRDDEKNDIVARHGSSLAGTAAFRKALEPAIGALETRRLFSDTRQLDRAAEVITFNEDLDAIRIGLVGTGLSEAAQTAIMAAVKVGEFDAFKGAGHISAKAAANILPGLMQGLVYSEACERTGYDHSASAVTSIDAVTSPVARKALAEMLKQIQLLERVYGNRRDANGKKRFDRVHVEMARDVGKSIEERGKMERGIRDRNAQKDRLRDELRNLLNLERVTHEDLLRYELWKEQYGFCLYSNAEIPIAAVIATDNRVQVDHILPWSRFGDDSYNNKTLCFVKQNADKRSYTPFEWFMNVMPGEWERFSSAVELCKMMRGFKKRNYLLRDAKEIEVRFRRRNLNDTRYALRALLAELGRQYHTEPDGSLRVFARPGELTSKLRQAWGIEVLKKGPNGERLPDDRHHALDAMVLTVTTNSLLQLATRISQEAERKGNDFHLRGLPPPWDSFRMDVENFFASIFVARQEIRRDSGKAHEATIKQIRKTDGTEVVYDRKHVEKLTEKDLDLIPVPEAYGKIKDPKKLRDQMVETLRAWIAAGKPKDNSPRSPKGDVIRRVRVRSSSKPAVRVRGGTADRGEIIRVDVFTKVSKQDKHEFFLVPIYVHEFATHSMPPLRAVQQGADESRWPQISSEFSFVNSIFPMSLIEIVKSDGEVIRGYYRSLDRNTGALTVSDPANPSIIRKGIGARTLLRLQKLRVDRLGNVREVKGEVRQWRGREFMSPGPQRSALPTAN